MKDRIPERLKELRKQKKLTLEKLAQRAGCTKSYISQLERGTSAPSLSMLSRLADALEIRVVQLFDEDPGKTHGDCHLKKDDRRTIHYPDGKVTSVLLTRGVFQKKLQPMLSIVEPGGMRNNSENIAHPKGSEEFVWVLKGEIDFEIGRKYFCLRKGDTLYFKGDISHRWMNNGNKTAEILFVWTPPVW